MGKYTEYAVKLENEFKKAREEYRAALSKLDSAQQAHDRAHSWWEEKYVGEREAARKRADADLTEAKANFKARGDEIWNEFYMRRQQIGQELSQAVNAGNLANTDDVDMAGVELLRSGIMSAADMRAFAKKYDSNPTMLRMLAKHASDRVESTADDSERGAFYGLAMRYKDGMSESMDNWAQLVKLTNYCSGAGHDGQRQREPHHALAMADTWEEICSSAVEHF